MPLPNALPQADATAVRSLLTGSLQRRDLPAIGSHGTAKGPVFDFAPIINQFLQAHLLAERGDAQAARRATEALTQALAALKGGV